MFQGMLCEFRPVDVAHVARREELGVEAEGCGERVGSLTAAGTQFQIVAEQFAVDRVGAVVDDLVGAFNRIEAAQVGDALVGDDDVDGVFGVVDVRHHRNDIRNLAFLRDRGAGEDRNVGVAGEVA